MAVSLCLSLWAAAQTPYVVINELNADNPGGGGPGGGTDAAEFLELFGEPNAALDSLVLVFFNGGQGGVSYGAYDLDGYALDAYGFFTIGASTVNGVDYIFPNATNNIQNGADAVVLYMGDAVDFPTGTLPSMENIVDAMVYGTNDAQDDALIAQIGLDVLVPGYTQLDETAQTNGTDLTLSRIPDGGAVFSLAYVTQALTPDTYNQPPCVASAVQLNPSDATVFCNNIEAMVSWLPFSGTGNYLTAITDAEGVIAATTQDTLYDFTGQVGVWSIYHIAYTQNLLNGNDAVGLTLADLIADECLNVSAPAMVEIQMCTGCAAGMVLINGEASGTAIVNEQADTFVFSNTSSSTTASYAYALTDGNGLFIQLVDGSFDFNDLTAGAYFITGVSYMGNVTWPAAGSPLTDITSDVCYEVTAVPASMQVVVIPYVVINELNADNPGGGGPGGGQDATEFIELYGEPNASLNGLTLVFYNGNGAVSYASYDLDGYALDAFGFFVLGSATMAESDMILNPNTSAIQNGADAVALVIGDATSYPNDTPINANNLVDALVYGTDDAQDDALIAGLGLDVTIPGYFQQNETAQNNGIDLTLSRVPDGGAAFNTLYVVQALTPGTWNLPPCTIGDVVLADATSSAQFCDNESAQWTMGAFTGTGEYIYVLTNANNSIVAYQADADWNWNGALGEYHVFNVAFTGVLDMATLGAGLPVAGIMADECVAVSESFVTITIVGCSGCIGGEVALNGLSGATIIPDGGMIQLELSNSSTSINDGYSYALLDADSNFVSWITSSFDFGALALGQYYVVGISYQGAVSGATSGQSYTAIIAATCLEFSSNLAPVLVTNITPVVINEMNADNPGGPDTAEFVELYGTPNGSLDNLVIVCYDGATSLSYVAFDLDGYTLDENGFFVLGDAATTNVDYVIPDATIQNGSDAIAIYVGNAVDFPNDSPITTINMIDALVYATGDAQVDALITGLGLDVMFPGYSQFDETAQQNGFDLTQSRVPDGGAPFDPSTLVLQPLTPGTYNIVPMGCIDQQACNYNVDAMMDDGSCYFTGDACDDGDPETAGDSYDANCLCVGLTPLDGCTDDFACNFNPLATTNDGSCLYITDPCDDGDPNTINDVYDSDCLCAGIVGVSEVDAVQGWNIFPNPALDQIRIDWSYINTAAMVIEIIDAQGRVAMIERHVNAHNGSLLLDVSSLPSGVYTVRWTSSQGTLNKLLVKQ